jgi:hypothetical protein
MVGCDKYASMEAKLYLLRGEFTCSYLDHTINGTQNKP